NTEQKPDSPLEGEDGGQRHEQGAAPTSPPIPAHQPSTAERPAHTDAKKGEEEGTEFWPTFLGLRLKVTDSLLVLFTAALVGVTCALVRSTNKLWEAGERQINVALDAVKVADKSASAADLQAR